MPHCVSVLLKTMTPPLTCSVALSLLSVLCRPLLPVSLASSHPPQTPAKGQGQTVMTSLTSWRVKFAHF